MEIQLLKNTQPLLAEVVSDEIIIDNDTQQIVDLMAGCR